MKNCTILLISMLLICVISCNNKNNNPSIVESNSDSIPMQDSTSVQDSSMVRIGTKMEKSGGVYLLPCVVNGVKMNFIFDTGASNVSISLTEALFLLKNGYLEDYDILGSSLSQVADGSIVENTEINLHSIEVNGIIITDVKAVVSNSIDAPLLLGQSAIQKLGKIEISGDSLYIIRKGISQPQPKSKSQTTSSVSPTTTEMKEPSFWRRTFEKESVMMDYLNRAYNLDEEGMTELALSYCYKAREMKKNSWKPYALLGYIYYYKENDKTAEDYYEKYRELNKKQETLYFENGDSLTYRGAMWKLAWVYTDNNKPDNAIMISQQLLEMYPNYAFAIKPMIAAYCDKGEYEKATNWAKKLLEMPEQKLNGYFYLGYINAEQGRKTEAIRYYEKVLEIEPNNSDALYNLSVVYYDINRPYAIELRKRAARLGDKNSINWLKENNIDW
jgi:clan AA aspartic protease (TIGR02281 family)